MSWPEALAYISGVLTFGFIAWLMMYPFKGHNVGDRDEITKKLDIDKEE